MANRGFARIEPGVVTPRQLARALSKKTSASGFELSGPALRELLAELAAASSYRAAGVAQDFVRSPRVADYLVGSFRRLRLSGLGSREAAGALRASGGAEIGGVMARLYSEYLDLLRRHRLYDEAAVFEAATDFVDKVPPRELLIVDLPGSPTPIEERLIQRIGVAASEVLVAMPGPSDRFAAATRFRTGWQRAFGRSGEEVILPAPSHRVPNDLVRLRAEAFSDREPCADAINAFRVAAAADAQSAARETARRVKRLLVDGARPREILLALPNLEAEAHRYASALAECGVPHEVAARPPARLSPALGALLDLLAVANSDWSFESLVAILRRADLEALRGNAPPPGFASRTAAAEWFVRSLQVPAGERYIQRQAETMSRPASAADSRLAAAAGAARDVFAVLADELDAAPREATPLGWVTASAQMLKRIGYAATETQAIDSAALGAFQTAAASLEGLARRRSLSIPTWTVSEYARRARGWAHELRLNVPESSEAVVRIVDLRTTLGLSCEHLLVGDAGETAFSPAEGDADAEAAMLRFFQLVAVPSKSLVFTYARRDDAGQPLLPSPYVAECLRLFGASESRDVETPDSDPVSVRDLRHAAVESAVQGDGRPLAEMTARGRAELLNGVRAVHERVAGEHFGAWEGVIRDRAAAADFKDRFGPRRLWSATQLETLAACPFKFFATDVLTLQPPGEMAVSVDHRRRGSLMHDALAEASANVGANAGADWAERLAAIVRERVDPTRLPPHESSLAEIEARQAIAWAASFPRQQATYAASKHFDEVDGPLLTAAVEFRFGPRTGDGFEDPASTDRCLEFALPSGEVLQIVGRIDRVDAARDANRVYFTVIDYKTAREYGVKLEAIREGRQLQPVLYALAAQRLLIGENAIPVAAGYWVVRKEGFVAPKPKDLPMVEFVDGEPRASAVWNELVAEIGRNTEEVVAAARRGEFPMDHPDKDCGRTCDFRTICRVAQARSLGRVRPGGGDRE